MLPVKNLDANEDMPSPNSVKTKISKIMVSIPVQRLFSKMSQFPLNFLLPSIKWKIISEKL